MRTQFIPCETLADAQDSAPWAAEIIEVEGGFMAFESPDDAATWRNQI